MKINTTDLGRIGEIVVSAMLNGEIVHNSYDVQVGDMVIECKFARAFRDSHMPDYPYKKRNVFKFRKDQHQELLKHPQAYYALILLNGDKFYVKFVEVSEVSQYLDGMEVKQVAWNRFFDLNIEWDDGNGKEEEW